VEQLISISKSLDGAEDVGGIGSIAQSQFERLKLDLQLKDADNKFLQEELNQKDRVMAMLTDGLKEVGDRLPWHARNMH
jgi:23S rRNA A2030 N6-methylase RlmJ